MGNNELELNSSSNQMLAEQSKARVAELAILTMLQSCLHPACQNTVLVVWVLSKPCLQGHEPMQLCTAVAQGGRCHQHRHDGVLQYRAEMGRDSGTCWSHLWAVTK